MNDTEETKVAGPSGPRISTGPAGRSLFSLTGPTVNILATGYVDPCRCFPPSFGSFGKVVSEEKIFRNRPIRNKNCLCLLMNQDEMSNLYRGPSKFRFIWQSGFKGRFFFRNQPIRNKNGLWRPCLLTDRDEMSNLYRGPAIDVSYQVSVHLAKRFQRRRLKKIGQSETRIAYGDHVC